MTEEDIHIPLHVLAIAFLVAFGIWMPLFIVPPLEDVISTRLGVSHANAALLYSLPVAMLAVAAIPSGFLADKIGIKKTIGIGAAVLAAGSALRGVVDSYPLIIVFTLVYGIGLGMCFPNIPKLARYCSTKARANATVSLLTVGVVSSGAVSLAIAVPVFLEYTGSFRGAFIVSTIPVFIALALWWLFIHEPLCPSAGIVSGGIDLKTLGRVFKRGDLWLVAFLFLLHNYLLYTWAGWLPRFLASIGADTNLAGIIASVTLWAGVPTVFLLSRLSPKLNRRKPFLWGTSLVLGVITYAILFTGISMSWLLVAIAGIATSLRFATILALPVEMVEPWQAGSASGMAMSVGYCGALLGPVIGGLILDTTGNFDWIFLSLVIVSAATFVLSLFVPETGGAGKYTG